MKKIIIDEVFFEPCSVVDQVGKVFYMDDKIFRAITPPYADFVERTIEHASKADWFDIGLIPTWRTNYSLPGYPLVIEHKKIPFVTLRGEWSGEGLRNAALCILNINAKLLRSNLCLKDAHPWNVLFDGTRPFFIDWGSISPLNELNWGFWFRQFNQYVLVPLYLFSIGEPRIARAMLREHEYGVGNEIFENGKLTSLRNFPREIACLVDESPTIKTFEFLSNYVQTLNMPYFDGGWASYAQPKIFSDNNCGLREKDRIVHGLLDELEGKTLVDIGANYGLHSEMASRKGKRVLALEVEESCLNSLYSRTLSNGQDILPLFHNFLWSIGSSGILNSIPAAEERLACDTALMMALTHHLVFKHHISFEAIARGISSLARCRAIVEFIPAEDVHVALWSPERFPWYNLDTFLAAMRRHFKNHSIIPSEPSPRCMIILEK